MKEIAVVTKNKTLARLIELEALSCGVTSKIFAAFPRDCDIFSVVFVDADSTEFLTDNNDKEKVVQISRAFGSDVQRKLCYPPSLVRIREYIVASGQIAIIDNSFGSTIDEKILCIDERQNSVRIDGDSYSLSDYEMKLLKYLCERSGNVATRTELSKLLGADSGNICDVYVCHLRKKLEKNGERKVIYTVRNKGYMTRYKSEKIK